jgi:hypothetical protein
MVPDMGSNLHHKNVRISIGGNHSDMFEAIAFFRSCQVEACLGLHRKNGLSHINQFNLDLTPNVYRAEFLFIHAGPIVLYQSNPKSPRWQCRTTSSAGSMCKELLKISDVSAGCAAQRSSAGDVVLSATRQR